MIHFGMPTMIESPELEAHVALCKRLGLKFVELNLNLPIYHAQQVDVPLFARMAAENAIYYTLHLDDNMDVCDFNPRVAKAYVDTVLETIEMAKRLPVPIINMHLAKGAYFTLPERKVFLIEEYEPQYLANMAAFRDACEKAIGDADLTIAVENCGGYVPSQLRALEVLLASPKFALTMDIGHNACAGRVDEPFILAHSHRLRHMHMHDALAKMGKDHMTLGTGELDIPWHLNLARECACTVVLETKTKKALEESVAWLEANGHFGR